MRGRYVAAGLFLVLSFSAFAFAGGQCIPSVEQDYAKQYGPFPKTPEMTKLPLQLSLDHQAIWAVAANDSCGARGCDYAIYAFRGLKCYSRLALFTGTYRVLPSSTAGMKDIEVTEKGPYPSKAHVQILRFNPMAGEYLP